MKTPLPYTVRRHMEQLRQLILEHPHLAEAEIELHPHGSHHRQLMGDIHVRDHEHIVVFEAERK